MEKFAFVHIKLHLENVSFKKKNNPFYSFVLVSGLEKFLNPYSSLNNEKE